MEQVQHLQPGSISVYATILVLLLKSKTAHSHTVRRRTSTHSCESTDVDTCDTTYLRHCSCIPTRL